MLYASLVGPLLGMFYPVPTEHREVAAVMMNTSKLKNLWCSIYSYEGAMDQINRFGGTVLSETYAKKLDYDSHAVHEVIAELLS